MRVRGFPSTRCIKSMKRFVLLVLLFLSTPVAGQGVIPVDRIVAVVNKDVITATELSEAVAGRSASCAARKRRCRSAACLSDRCSSG
jgi:hypothetical protein